MKPKTHTSTWTAWISSKYSKPTVLDPDRKWWQFRKPKYLLRNAVTGELKSREQLDLETKQYFQDRLDDKRKK